MKTVVVAGAVGVIGRGVLAHYEDKNVNLVAVSRRTPDFTSRAKHFPVDLLDRDSCEALLSQVPDATHLVLAAYQWRCDAQPVCRDQVGIDWPGKVMDSGARRGASR
ncbi:NAD-dependent epimerase/dehydratase family protein [Paraburkholderia sp. BL18I3N2]|uniref:NAD-dependent epimerase/dehydratase family protein n=1 Tax=Paraburkholderia sp. BL18I3N2 TaxID=1938799 RepID=UPI0035BE5036